MSSLAEVVRETALLALLPVDTAGVCTPKAPCQARCKKKDRVEPEVCLGLHWRSSWPTAPEVMLCSAATLRLGASRAAFVPRGTNAIRATVACSLANAGRPHVWRGQAAAQSTSSQSGQPPYHQQTPSAAVVAAALMSHNLSDLDKVVSRLDSETRNRLSQVILANSELQEDTAEEFRKADTNSDNMIDEQ